MNHDRTSPVTSIKLSYLAGLFIHTVGGIAEHVKSKRCSSGFTSTFSSRPRKFCSRVTYAVFEDKNHMVFGTIDAHMEYTDCVNQLNSLVANLQPANPQLL